MAASSETLPTTLQNHAMDGEWTIVTNQKRRRMKPTPGMPEAPVAWIPAADDTSPERVSKLLQKIDSSMKKVESSSFYHDFFEQLQSEEVSNSFSVVLGSEEKMQVVIYGIGSVESYETPRLQLSLALLMKRKFEWMGEIEIFDPVLSVTECRALETLGCSVLSINEQGCRCVLSPTLFFMPHCEAKLYDNLLRANWNTGKLSRLVLFGNSFQKYGENAELGAFRCGSARHVLAATPFTVQFEIPKCEGEFLRAFNDSSWHFFSKISDTELPILN
ncbi:hypothetical protein MLD38_027373 [Melastoma candidum]|uniref:Uncharacterized protein n=1 Tax=Melastoma candidum TaxID=119954 RepID=A0ACB9P1K2_9MYRT|nr:hypothetical protein MLD38_027373 [Melastoma candidum]